MRFRLLIAGIVLAGALAASCANGAPTDSEAIAPLPTTTTSVVPTPPAAQPTSSATINTAPPKMTIMTYGTCQDNGGIRLQSIGLTPNKPYKTDAWYPNGKAYTFISDGIADGAGTTPGWRWDCYLTANGQPDPVGIYVITLTDLTTGAQATTTLTVRY